MTLHTGRLPRGLGFGPGPAPLWAAAGAICLSLAVLPGLEHLVETWGQAEYSYGWLIPVLAAVIIRYRARDLAIGPGAAWGVIAMVLSVPLLIAGRLSGMFTIMLYGYWIGLVGLTAAAFGIMSLRRLGGPLFYLLFMIPLPHATYLGLSSEMQLVASKLGVALVRLLGVSVFLDGNVIVLAPGKLEVAEACDGLRYLFPLISFGVLLALLLQDAWWKKVILVLSTLPIAVVLNAMRIAMISALVDRLGMGMASGPQHAIEGFVVFGFCVGLLLGEVWLLMRVGPQGRFLALRVLLGDRRAASPGPWTGPSRALLVATAVAVLAMLASEGIGERPEVVPVHTPLTLFPLHAGSWVGRPDKLDNEYLSVLSLSDYLLVDYTEVGQEETPVNFFVAYYASQGFGVTAHNPEQCIPGGGWTIDHLDATTVAITPAASLPVRRAMIHRQGVRLVVYYWFQERERHLTDEYSAKAYTILDAIVRGRTDGALVRVTTELLPGQSEQVADDRLVAFLHAGYPLLEQYLPD
ncbi:MAG: VPLPA-CTERM-specific exosortase XrtD [Azospirillaceae bacterium]|nr:VPLPA-CTERM-specific exosortase XrtD [Azospirillaceae bacterium]